MNFQKQKIELMTADADTLNKLNKLVESIENNGGKKTTSYAKITVSVGEGGKKFFIHKKFPVEVKNRLPLFKFDQLLKLESKISSLRKNISTEKTKEILGISKNVLVYYSGHRFIDDVY